MAKGGAVNTPSSMSAEPHCPRCGAAIRPDAESCWLCRAPIDVSEVRLAAAAAEIYSQYSARPKPAHRFSLASLMMFVTLICVMLGVTTIAAGIGIPLGLIVLLVWVPTALWAVTPRLPHSSNTLLGSIGTVLSIIGVVAVIACVAMVMLFAAVLAAIVEFCSNLPGA